MSDVKVQAEKILKAYAEDSYGLDEIVCASAGFTGEQCGVLKKVLDKGVNGEITSQEMVELAKVGFAKEFIQEISGTDGKKALERRALFFAPQIQREIAALKDSNANVRREAAVSLGLIGDSRAVEPLVAALNDSSASVSAWVAWALGMIGDLRAVEPLIAALKYPVGEVRISTVAALEKILVSAGWMAFIPYLRDLEQMVAGRVDDCNVGCLTGASDILQKLEEEMR